MRPALGFLALILAAIGLAAYTAHLRPAPDPTPAEKDAMEAAKQSSNKPPETKSSATPPTSPMPPPMPSDEASRNAMFDKYKDGAVTATMEIEGRGTLKMELYPKAAPKTVAHFTDLIKQGFYNGILFHRVEPGFVVQGGDPNTKKVKQSDLQGPNAEQVKEENGLGTGGSGATVPPEWVLPHTVNSIGLARSQAEDSGDSQFYFNLKDNGDALDGKYCVFGRVVSGSDILPQIQVGDRIKSVTIP